MLRTNTKKAKNNVRNWIISNCTFDNDFPDYFGFPYLGQYEKFTELVHDTTYTNGINYVDLFSVYAPAIYETFRDEKGRYDKRYQAGKISEQSLFIEWLEGLPGVIDTTCYYLGPNAKTIVADLLEETAAERDKYTETEAESLLSYLIYREVKSEVNRQYSK